MHFLSCRGVRETRLQRRHFVTPERGEGMLGCWWCVWGYSVLPFCCTLLTLCMQSFTLIDEGITL